MPAVNPAHAHHGRSASLLLITARLKNRTPTSAVVLLSLPKVHPLALVAGRPCESEQRGLKCRHVEYVWPGSGT